VVCAQTYFRIQRDKQLNSHFAQISPLVKSGIAFQGRKESLCKTVKGMGYNFNKYKKRLISSN
jgi:hypothetical protein